MLFVHLIVTLVRLLRPGSYRTIIAESLLLEHGLEALDRSGIGTVHRNRVINGSARPLRHF